jgi:DNA-directed RNA polymerase subunit RPC12/RpoP
VIDFYCNACGARLSFGEDEVPADGRCPNCQSRRTMRAPHVGPYGSLAEAGEEEFGDFVGRAAFGERQIGTRHMSFAFELPWLQYDNETVRVGLSQAAPDLSISVPYRKPGETRGPAEDLLVFYMTKYALATHITVWVGVGLAVREAHKYLQAHAPWVRLNEGAAFSLASAEICETLGERDLDYAFNLPSEATAPLSVTIPERAFLVGFSSPSRVAWCVVGDEGQIHLLDHADHAPDWWNAAMEIDAKLPATPFPRAREF